MRGGRVAQTGGWALDVAYRPAQATLLPVLGAETSGLPSALMSTALALTTSGTDTTAMDALKTHDVGEHLVVKERTRRDPVPVHHMLIASAFYRAVPVPSLTTQRMVTGLKYCMWNGSGQAYISQYMQPDVGGVRW